VRDALYDEARGHFFRGRPVAIMGATRGPGEPGFYLERLEDALRLAMVHVRSHSRQRQHVATVMTLASVSMILPLQNGHAAGRATSSVNRESSMTLCPFSDCSNPNGCAG
jgi:hypothetical protein